MARLCAEALRLPAYERGASKVFLDHPAGVAIVYKSNVFRTFLLPRPPCEYAAVSSPLPLSVPRSLSRRLESRGRSFPRRCLPVRLAAISDDGGRQLEEEAAGHREKTVTCVP